MASLEGRLMNLLSDADLNKLSKLLGKYGLSNLPNAVAAGRCFDLSKPQPGGGDALSGLLMATIPLLLASGTTPKKQLQAAVNRFRAVCEAPGRHVTTMPLTQAKTPDNY